MSAEKIEAGAIILAGGLSTRYGGHHKALADFQGRPLLEWAALAFRRCGLDRVTVVTGHARDQVEALAARLGARAAYNPDYQAGMFGSVQTGVRALTGPEAFFILPVDAALVQSQTVLSLLTAWAELGRGQKGPRVLIPVCQGQTGHPPLIDGRLAKEILNWTGPGGLRGWLASLMPRAAGGNFLADGRPTADGGPVVFLDWPDEGIVCDLDTPAELAAARLPAGRSRPTAAEARQLLLQLDLPPVKIEHSRLVAGGARRLAEGLKAAGLEADPESALLAGLLHDALHREKKPARAGRILCQEMGWPELALAVGAHTDPPPAVLEMLGPAVADDGEDYGPDNPAYQGIDPATARVALAVYLADKYWQNERPVNLAQRFQISRDFFRRGPKADDPAALAAVDRRERAALAVEGWFRATLGAEPDEVARRGD